jgi:hypothetical protein
MQTQIETEPLTDDPEHRIVVEDPDGSIKTIVLDLQQELGNDPQHPVYMRSALDPQGSLVVEIEAKRESSLEWLASWLEASGEYYRTEFVDASYERRAARDLFRAVSEYLAVSDEVGD